MSAKYRQKANQSGDCVAHADESADYIPHADRVARIKGRGTHQSPKPRYHSIDRESYTADQPMKLDTTVKEENCRNIITRIRSPDLPIEQSVNPYRGCEHGCIYCYARPSHAWLDLSPGIDFETRLFARSGADKSLRRQLMKKNLSLQSHCIGVQYRSLSTDRASLANHPQYSAGVIGVSSSLYDCDQVLVDRT